MPQLSFQCRHQYPSGFAVDVSFGMDQRFTALFGPSGSGKTSILSMIAGFTRPQAGRIVLAGRTLVDTSQGICLVPEQRHVGMVFQDSLLFPHLSVEGNLRYGQRRRHRPGRKVEFARVVDVLEIGPLLRRRPASLSGGERQRVALGRALLSAPELLVMDEPLASLDGSLKLKVLAYLERVVAEWDVPTLFVTHSQAEVRRAAGWVVVINQGRLVTAGSPEEALSEPEPLGWGNSAGPMNLLRADSVEPRAHGVTVHIGDQTLTVSAETIPDVSPVFVQFSPADVILGRQTVKGLSARNQLQGRVCQVIPTGRAVFVAIDVGQVLWAEITPEAAAELGLETGSQVTCLIKAHRLSVVA
jgi:molybdate transport system ATP-binding protein